MTNHKTAGTYPDSPARCRACKEHKRTLLVEAGPGTGKTALLAGRVALLIASGIHPKEIVAITFTRAAASELLERIVKIVERLKKGNIDAIPNEIKECLPNGLTDSQKKELETNGNALDELTCTTINGFCQELIRPYPDVTKLDPSAEVIDSAAAKLAYQDLINAWLSARFGRNQGKEGLGRFPALRDAESNEDFLIELMKYKLDKTLKLIREVADFLMEHRIAHAPREPADQAAFTEFENATQRFADWYENCDSEISDIKLIIEDLERVAELSKKNMVEPLTGRSLAELVFHEPPSACKKTPQRNFRKLTKKANEAKSYYEDCEHAYIKFCAAINCLAFGRLVSEFAKLRELYCDYKQEAALVDFDDQLHYALKLLRENKPIRSALAKRYPFILVDEFQDTDPVQAEILWRLAGENCSTSRWHEIAIRPGALFLVGDPKQAIYRFRGADLDSYQSAKEAIIQKDKEAILKINTNFRSREPILNYLNKHFSSMLDQAKGQPGYTALSATRPSDSQPNVAGFKVKVNEQHKNKKGNLIIDCIRHEEAEAVAEVATQLIGSYAICPNDSPRRPAQARDIALIAPTGTNLWIYEQALEKRGIPIATQAGKGFFSRQEVQDMIATARAIADSRNTLALGALIRGPLVGLTEEAIADIIESLHHDDVDGNKIHLWIDTERIGNPILTQTLCALQDLAKNANSTTPYLLLCEAVEKLNVRPILKLRHPQGAERALANIDLLLEMSRAYAGRGIAEFARVMWQRWTDSDSQVEGKLDAETDAVSIITMHSAKGLEWPIVIPINSMTKLETKKEILIQREDQSVYYQIFNLPDPKYDELHRKEKEELRRERVRLWYVALTRAKDLLLLPKQECREDNDWLSLIEIDVQTLPTFGIPASKTTDEVKAEDKKYNYQDIERWQQEAEKISSNRMRIERINLSRHEGSKKPKEEEEEILSGIELIQEITPEMLAKEPIQSGKQRENLLHKLMEEILTGEAKNDRKTLRTRAAKLIAQLGLEDKEFPSSGTSSVEIAATIARTLDIPQIASLLPKLTPEFQIYSCEKQDKQVKLTTGIADAVVLDSTGRINTVIDWNADDDPDEKQVERYRQHIRDYLRAANAQKGLIVFLKTSRIETIINDQINCRT